MPRIINQMPWDVVYLGKISSDENRHGFSGNQKDGKIKKNSSKWREMAAVVGFFSGFLSYENPAELSRSKAPGVVGGNPSAGTQ